MSALLRDRHGLTWILLLLVAGAALASCRGNSSSSPPSPEPTTSGSARGYELGLSSLPSELTQESYEDAFRLAAAAGDMILIQRTPPWQEMVSGQPSEDTARTTKRETELARKYGLDIFFAIDPIEAAGPESKLADLPPDLDGADFSDERIQNAFLSYARYVAENYHPKYLALGVEVNSYQQNNARDFEQFVVLYHRAYQAVRDILPDALIFPTFQYEELQGLLPRDNPFLPQWYLIQRFEPRIDVLAVSSYPSLAYDDINVIPPSYFAQLNAYTKRPIAISGMGYSSQTVTSGDAEAQQAEFLLHALDNAQQLSMRFVVWFVGTDLTFADQPPFDRLAFVGLRRQDDSAKPAWQVWEAAAARPFAAPTPERTERAASTPSR